MKTRTGHNTKYRFARSNKQQPIQQIKPKYQIRVKVSVCKNMHVYVCVFRCMCGKK